MGIDCETNEIIFEKKAINFVSKLMWSGNAWNSAQVEWNDSQKKPVILVSKLMSKIWNL